MLKQSVISFLMIATLFAATACEKWTDKAAQEAFPEELKQVLINASHATMYSLEANKPKEKLKKNLHGYKLLGSAKIDGEIVKSVSNEYVKSLQAYKDEITSGVMRASGCMFQPRHALRITTSDKHTYDFLVCFSCGQIAVYKDKVHYWGGQVRGAPDKLNAILVAKHLPLSEKYH